MKITVFGTDGTRETYAEALPGLLRAPGETIWVDITGSGEADFKIMHEVFHFHPLAIEDSRNQRQRPKIEEYDDHLFIILNPIPTDPERPTFREIDLFVGRNYVVTVHPDLEPTIEDAQRRVAHTGPTSQVSAGYLMYVLVDVVVDGYFPILDMIGQEIDDLEDTVLAHPSSEVLSRLFRLKRNLVDISRVVGPQRDMFNTLTRRDIAFLDQTALQYYLRDIYDHLLRITDTVNTFRDVLTSIVDLYLSVVSNRLNQVVNRLTIFTVTVGLVGAISGFYGMNFERTWPPFTEAWGVLFALGLMALIVGVILVVFRRLKWY